MSDTHGNYPLAIRACDQAGEVAAVLHLGDGTGDTDILADLLTVDLIGVSGNCDLGSLLPRELVWTWHNRRLLLVHGDRHGVKSGLGKLEQYGRQLGVDVVLYGHTHCPAIERRSGILFVNPGSLMQCSSPGTYAILEATPTGIAASLHEVT